MLKELRGMSRLPLIRPNGTFVDRPGYDEESHIFCHYDDEAFEAIPDDPSEAEIVGALETIWQPWKGYHFATADDRAGMLSAIFTALCRPGLDVAPGYFIEAPTQGSGKSKAAAALGALMLGKRPPVIPYAGGEHSNDEMRKRLVALAVEGASYALFDNVVGTWRSAALAAAMGMGVVSDRLLGVSRNFNGPFRTMVTATGNNASLDLDLGRRFIRVRIDPKCACPQAREFSFDPVDSALAMRLAIARGVLICVQAYQAAGAPALGRGDAGFAEWNRLVRRCVLWLASKGYCEAAGLVEVGDPAASIMERAAADDPETQADRALLQALDEFFDGAPFAAKDIWKVWDVASGGTLTGEAGAMVEAFKTILPGRRDVTNLTLGRCLLNRRDKIVGGLVLRKLGEDRNGAAVWCVVQTV